VCPESLRLAKVPNDPLASHVLLVERVLRQADAFDIIHFHFDYLHLPAVRRCGVPFVTTLHGRLDLPENHDIFYEFRELPFVSISNAQREPMKFLQWMATIYHGLPRSLYAVKEEPGDYLVFLGRISPEKRVDRAVEIARKAGLPLKVAAKIDKVDQAYYHAVAEPLFAQPGVEFVGEVNDQQKHELLSNARALLFPIDWPEPFGLVMTEAMACGTPVIAFRRGSVPEVIDEGVSGFIVESVEEAVAAIPKIASLSRLAIRQQFEKRFSADRMAEDYVALYEILQQRTVVPVRSTQIASNPLPFA
jgi:glycosyltransferase involved in cell wall biosynthesis